MQTTDLKPGRKEGSKNRSKNDPLYRRGNYGYSAPKKKSIQPQAISACLEKNQLRSDAAFNEGIERLRNTVHELKAKGIYPNFTYKMRQKNAMVNKVCKFLENQIRRERRGILTESQREHILSIDFMFSGESFDVSLRTRGFPKIKSQLSPP